EGFVTRIAPALGGRVHTERLVLRLDAQLAYDRYEGTEHAVPDSWNVHAALSGTYRVTRRLSLSASDQFADAHDPLEIDRVGIVTPPGVQIIDNTTEARASYAATRALTVEGLYTFHTTEFGDVPGGPGAAPAAPPSGDVHELSARTAYQL